MTTVVCVLFFVSAAAAVLFRNRHRELQRQIAAERASADGKLAALERRAAQGEEDQQLVRRFLREFPHVTHEMYTGANVRKIPGLLLTCLTRFFEPQKAMVAIRRRPTAHEPNRGSFFTVAASFPDRTCVPPGTVFAIGAGEIGFAAEVQRVMNRSDLDGLTASVKLELAAAALPGITPDLVAPLVFEENTVAVMALEGLRRWPVDPRDVIRLIAQVGALAVHSLERLTHMKTAASLDGLTGIFNKRFLDHRLAEAIRDAPPGACLSVFLFDLDNFKHYNDRNGHVAGDTLLRQMASLVQENIRKNSTFGRFGGEEFLLVLPNSRKGAALAAAENVRRLIAEFRFAEAAGQPLGCVSISGGVAEYPLDAQEASSLLRAADEALYAAKREGRNRVVAYAPTYLGLEEAVEPTGDPLLLPEGERPAGELSQDPDFVPVDDVVDQDAAEGPDLTDLRTSGRR